MQGGGQGLHLLALVNHTHPDSSGYVGLILPSTAMATASWSGCKSMLRVLCRYCIAW